MLFGALRWDKSGLKFAQEHIILLASNQLNFYNNILSEGAGEDLPPNLSTLKLCPLKVQLLWKGPLSRVSSLYITGALFLLHSLQQTIKTKSQMCQNGKLPVGKKGGFETVNSFLPKFPSCLLFWSLFNFFKIIFKRLCLTVQQYKIVPNYIVY